MDLDAEHTDQQQTSAMRSILQRKVALGRAVHQARAVSLPKALRVTLAKVADDLFDMAMAVIGVRVEDHTGDDLAGPLEVPGLLMLLDGPARRRAAAVLDPVLVGGLIQQETMGQVMADPGGASRKMTATDAAIAAPLIDALLKRAAVLPETPEERAVLRGFHFRSQVEDSRLLQMALDEHEYRVIRLTVDIAGGVRQGQLTLVMPLVDAEETLPGGGDGSGGGGPHGADRRGTLDGGMAPPPRNKMSDTVMALNVDLVVALAQLKMPLSDLSSLRIGDTLDLGAIAFDGAKVLTEEGKVVGRGSVGQVDGMRALKMAREDEAFAHPMRRASDRDALNLPQVSGDGLGLGREDTAAVAAPALTFDSPAALPDMADLPDLDMPELPSLDPATGGADLPEVEDMPDLGGALDGLDLPDLDLPDLDLPDLDLPDLDLPDLPNVSVA